MKNSWFNISISFIALIIAIVAICCSVDEDVLINDQSIVLGFVGILATFVVVGNYAQVKDTERKFEKKIEEINRKLEEINKNQSLMDGSELVANALINACRTDEVIKAISHNGWVDGETKEVEFRLKEIILYKKQDTINCEISIVETNGTENGCNLENFTRITIGDKTTVNIHGVVYWLYKKKIGDKQIP